MPRKNAARLRPGDSGRRGGTDQTNRRSGLDRAALAQTPEHDRDHKDAETSRETPHRRDERPGAPRPT
ncbi:MAG: hypothetical protein MZU95_16130 [Desulfomicrobium escambiense]|nr:hypothetical protein [Desulfomicrobium escambiense]